MNKDLVKRNSCREMSLKDVQKVSLDILKDVHAFCVENNISYTLYGGTMIGAIRHKGFIPWDDDVDIAMPRPDYEKFLSSYQSKHGYRLFGSGSSESYLAFSRVCEMDKTLVVNEKAPWTKIPTGVWIDIFPLDGAPDDKNECFKQLNRLRKCWKQCCYARGALSSFSHATGAYNKLKLLVKKLVFNDCFVSQKIVVTRYINEASKIKWGLTQHFWNCSYLRYGIKEYQEMSDITSFLQVQFEDSLFNVCNGYDHLMRTKYGDYMQLPPTEKQKSNHGMCSYFWRS